MYDEKFELHRTVETIMELIDTENVHIEREYHDRVSTYTINMSNFRIKLEEIPTKRLFMSTKDGIINLSKVLPALEIARYATAIENLYKRQQNMRGPVRIEELISNLIRNHKYSTIKQAQSNQIMQSVVNSK